MDQVYYMLLGVLAFAGIGLLAVAIFKLVIFVGEKIEEWVDDRRRMKRREEIGQTPIEWSKDGKTGRVVTDKPLTPDEAAILNERAEFTKPEPPKPKKFHRHMWRFLNVRNGLEYQFTCECGDFSSIPLSKFWGSPTIRSERALKRAEILYASKKEYDKVMRTYQEMSW